MASRTDLREIQTRLEFKQAYVCKYIIHCNRRETLLIACIDFCELRVMVGVHLIYRKLYREIVEAWQPDGRGALMPWCPEAAMKSYTYEQCRNPRQLIRFKLSLQRQDWRLEVLKVWRRAVFMKRGNRSRRNGHDALRIIDAESIGQKRKKRKLLAGRPSGMFGYTY